MVKRSERMKVVADLAKRKEEQEAQQLSKLQQQLQAYQARLEELIQYRLEYQQRLHKKTGQGVVAADFFHFSNFIEQLTHVIEMQRQQVAQAQSELEKQKQVWYTANQYTDNLEKIIRRYQQQEVNLQEKREQNELDERALRISKNRSND